LIAATRRLIEEAMSRLPVNVHAAIETSLITAECDLHSGLHLRKGQAGSGGLQHLLAADSWDADAVRDDLRL
jgi:hypothetical protein